MKHIHVQRLPGSNQKTSWMEFFWFIGEAQVVVSSSGWWNLGLFLLALSPCHLAEPVAELPADDGKGPHATGASGLPPLGLDRPVVSPNLGCRETAGCTGLLLDVERNTSASPADGVRLVAPLSKGAGSLGHLGASHHYSETCGLLETGGQRSGLKVVIPS